MQLVVRVGDHGALGLKTSRDITRQHISDGVPSGRGPKEWHPIHLMRPCVSAAAGTAALLAVLGSDRKTRRPKTCALRQHRSKDAHTPTADTRTTIHPDGDLKFGFARRRGQGSGQEPQQGAIATWRTGSGRGAVGQHGWRTALCREASQRATRRHDFSPLEALPLSAY